MPIIRTIILSFFFLIFVNNIGAEEVKKISKNKDWETYVVNSETGKICFAQSMPILQAPKSNKRDARLFVTFRPSENIKDEVSLTSGHEYKSSTVVASSGKKRYSFFSQKNFAWLLDDQEEKNFIKLMKRATNLIIKARTTKGAETTDHYSMM